MQCSQAKPFTMSSTNAKMGGAAIKSYEKGGMVTKPKEKGIYTAEMGQPPQDIDGGSAPRKPAKPAKPAPKKK
jgi:hypothetical protein